MLNINITIPLAEPKLLKRVVHKFYDLKWNLEKVFTPGQVRCLMKPTMRRVRWSAEGIAAAVSLRSISPKAYCHLRVNVGYTFAVFFHPAQMEVRRQIVSHPIKIMWTNTFNK